jgi:RNA:NAD 2'-phosphotransferase (TPT1/KptA family)
MNNAIENLEWLSIADNVKHAFETGLVHTQKSVVLVNDKEKLQFRSYARAGVYLGRNVGYISDCIKKKRCAVADDGTKYKIVV